MPLPLYLAMTAAEIAQAQLLPEKLAYMACHFSPYGNALEGLPHSLPSGAMICINDRIPPMGQDPELICQQMERLVSSLQVGSVLLDLQRPGDPLTQRIARLLSEKLPCPVGVCAAYARECAGAVVLPLQPWEDPVRIAQEWPNRALWLEVSTACGHMQITAEGAHWQPAQTLQSQPQQHSDAACCRYTIHSSGSSICFEIQRNSRDIPQLLAQAHSAGFCCAVGLYQQLADCQKLPPPPP